jgi:cell division protein FtsQ
MTQFKIKKIEVSGVEHYTEQEMVQELKKHGYINNSLLYSLKCKIRPPENIPFVESMDVELAGQHTVAVTIYEKTMAGCIENMGEYMYFDKDGIVLESSSKKFDDVPLINGLQFDSVVLNEKLPFEDTETVKQILNLTQLIRKYKLSIDTIKFENDAVYLYYDKIEIALGDPSDVDEKMAELPNILEQAKGHEGTLHMEKFTVSSGSAYMTEK